MEHPSWCAAIRCRAARGGTHRSESVEVREGDTRITAWLQQQGDQEPLMALVAAYRLIGGPIAFVPVAKGRLFADHLGRLLSYAEAST